MREKVTKIQERIKSLLYYYQKAQTSTDLKSWWYQQLFRISLLSLVMLLSGCSSTSSIHSYFNSETKIKLDKPDNWTATFYKRNWMIVLEAKTGTWHQDSAQIEILGGSCPTNPTGTPGISKTPSDELEHEIQRFGELFNQYPIIVVQELANVENKNYEVAKAVIQIPTMSIGDSTRNRVGKPEPNKYQMIDIFVMQDRNDRRNMILISLYRGNSEMLNDQAQEIVNSIQRPCTP